MRPRHVGARVGHGAVGGRGRRGRHAARRLVAAEAVVLDEEAAVVGAAARRRDGEAGAARRRRLLAHRRLHHAHLAHGGTLTHTHTLGVTRLTTERQRRTS